MLYTKIQTQSFLGSEEDVFSALPYIGMAATLFNGAEAFEQIVNTLWTKGPIWNLMKIAQAVSEKTFLLNFINVYKMARADKP